MRKVQITAHLYYEGINDFLFVPMVGANIYFLLVMSVMTRIFLSCVSTFRISNTTIEIKKIQKVSLITILTYNVMCADIVF